MKTRDYKFLAFSLCLAACSEAADPAASTPRAAQPATPPAAHTLSSAALVDRQGDNWLVIGGPNVDLVGADGEPDSPAGRYINAGKGISAGSIGPDGWLVGGADGATTTLDADGKPIRGDVRITIDGKQIGFIAAGKDFNAVGELLDVFLIGGADGAIQLADNTGEPFEAKQAAAGTAPLTAGTFVPAISQWVFGAQDGVLYRMDSNFNPSPQGSPFGGAPIVAVFPNPDPMVGTAIVLGGGAASYYPAPNPVSLGQNIQITAAIQVGPQIIIGLADGRVGAISFNTLAPPAQWSQVFNNQPVTYLAHNGANAVAFDGAGSGVRLDASLAPMGAPVALGDGGQIRAARWSNDRWLLATTSSLILEVNASLQLISPTLAPLDGRELRAVSAGTPGALLAGDAGRVRLVSRLGQPLGAVQTVAGEPTLRAAGFSGKNWLVAGDGGAGQLVGIDGALQGQKLSLLGGREVRALAWSGTNWLAVGAEGYIQRVRDDGTTAGEPTKIASLDEIYGARWSGSEWMLVGSKDGRAAFQLVNSNANLRGDPGKIDRIMGPLYAAEWNGREWLLGGHAGNVQLVGADGTPRTSPEPQPRDALGGQDVLTIDYNNDTYLIGGRQGFVRQLRDNLQAPRSPVSVAAFKDVRGVVWTSPRGFAGGLCLTPTSCYSGPCLGTFKEGFCCDRSCDRPCESCTSDKTGQPDGTCAPITAGGQPATVNACSREPEASCGNTGVCDGAGECQLYDTAVSCQAAACSGGQIIPAGSCDGAGMCAVGAPTSCAPYATCDGAACAVSCVSSNDCVQGFVCQGGSCIVEPEPVPPKPKPPADEGCSAAGAAQPSTSAWLLALVGLIAGLRRRRSQNCEL
jgi:MYXO-CTERM domain-containing protein